LFEQLKTTCSFINVVNACSNNIVDAWWMNNAEQHCSDNIYQPCMFHQPCWRLFHHVSTTIVRSSSVHEQVVGTMLLTIVAWTTLFSHDDNIVQALFNEQRRTTWSIFTRVQEWYTTKRTYTLHVTQYIWDRLQFTIYNYLIVSPYFPDDMFDTYKCRKVFSFH
jgi:hypothetical protein